MDTQDILFPIPQQQLNTNYVPDIMDDVKAKRFNQLRFFIFKNLFLVDKTDTRIVFKTEWNKSYKKEIYYGNAKERLTISGQNSDNSSCKKDYS